MLNPGVFLVPAVHEVATAAELAVATGAAEKPDPHALTDRPSLDPGTKGLDPPDHFVAGDSGPVDRKHAFHRGGIRVADPASLHANAYLVRAGIDQRLLHLRELAPLRDLDCSVCRSHRVSSTRAAEHEPDHRLRLRETRLFRSSGDLSDRDEVGPSCIVDGTAGPSARRVTSQQGVTSSEWQMARPEAAQGL